MPNASANNKGQDASEGLSVTNAVGGPCAMLHAMARLRALAANRSLCGKDAEAAVTSANNEWAVRASGGRGGTRVKVL